MRLLINFAELEGMTIYGVRIIVVPFNVCPQILYSDALFENMLVLVR
jgi:hypothetical protein